MKPNNPTDQPHIWIDKFTEESFALVDKACDRWERRRKQLRRQARESHHDITPAHLDLLRRNGGEHDH